MEPVVRTVSLPGRVRLSYAEQGSPSGIPLLLLHGYTDSWRTFLPILPHLPPAMRVLAPTMRGHGASERVRSGYRPADLAGDVVAFLDALEVDAAVVVGHSMGSLVAEHVAVHAPERVRGLLLVGALTSMRGNPVAEELRGAVAGLDDPVDGGFARAFQESSANLPVPASFLDEIIRGSAALPARIWRDVLDGFFESDLVPAPGAITAPTLVVWGARDELCPRSGQDRLVAAIPSARLAVYPDSGHCPNWEEPERFAADLLDLVEAVERGGRGAAAGRAA